MISRCLSLLLFFVVVYMLFPRRQKLRRALKLWKNFWGEGILASGVGAKGIRSRMGMPLEEVFLFLGMRRLAL